MKMRLGDTGYWLLGKVYFLSMIITNTMSLIQARENKHCFFFFLSSAILGYFDTQTGHDDIQGIREVSHLDLTLAN